MGKRAVNNQKIIIRDGIYLAVGIVLGMAAGTFAGKTAIGVLVGAAIGGVIDEMQYRRRLRRMDCVR